MYPEHWSIKPFAEIADYETGRTPARANAAYWESAEAGIPWVAISDMENYSRITKTGETITVRAFQEVFRKRVVPAGTLLMSFKLTIGRVSTLSMDACHNEAIISIYPREHVDQRYLGYFLSQVDYAELQDRQVKGHTLNQDKINRISVALPPKTEQNNIAELLDLTRSAIESQKLSLRKTQELKRSAMHEFFTRGLRGEAQKETEIGLVPESWDVVPLGSFGRVGNGSTPKKTIPEYWNGGTYPWLTSAKVYDREIVQADQFVTDTALQKCHLPRIKPGAILIAITGQGKTLGHCAVLGMQATINQHIAYVATDTKRTNPSFIRGYLETQYDYLRQVGGGGGSTKGALTCAFLRTMLIPFPPTLDEQDEIVEILDAIDRKMNLHKRKKAVLEELFKSLLHKLMTGEIRVADLDLSAIKHTEAA